MISSEFIGPVFKEKLLEKVPLSVAIITKNEEENLRSCLKSIAFARQIVVVDSGSTDATLQIASEFGCEIYNKVWPGFGPQKQLAINKCREPWILVLDADEIIPQEHLPEGYSIFQKDSPGNQRLYFVFRLEEEENLFVGHQV